MSAAALGKKNRIVYPLFSQNVKESKKKDWIKTGAIVAMVIGGLIAALGVLCTMGILPSALLGGAPYHSIALSIGALILLPGAFVFYHKWRHPS